MTSDRIQDGAGCNFVNRFLHYFQNRLRYIIHSLQHISMSSAGSTYDVKNAFPNNLKCFTESTSGDKCNSSQNSRRQLTITLRMRMNCIALLEVCLFYVLSAVIC